MKRGRGFFFLSWQNQQAKEPRIVVSVHYRERFGNTGVNSNIFKFCFVSLCAPVCRWVTGKTRRKARRSGGSLWRFPLQLIGIGTGFRAAVQYIAARKNEAVNPRTRSIKKRDLYCAATNRLD